MKKWIVLVLLIVILAVGGVLIYKKTKTNTSSNTTNSGATTQKKSTPAPSSTSKPSQSSTPTTIPTLSQPQYSLPVANFLTGQTKKPFGIYIIPATSPVQPERFTGYHTGVDIEQVQDNTDVPVYAVNSGTVKFIGRVGGYGGVIIYETTINNSTVTILYGHIRLSSAQVSVGDTVTKGEKLSFLGTGYSSETDGERKHLHFSIHKGSQIVYLGYVQNQSQLSGWLNPDDIIR